jgi:hypothetical protein
MTGYDHGPGHILAAQTVADSTAFDLHNGPDVQVGCSTEEGRVTGRAMTTMNPIDRRRVKVSLGTPVADSPPLADAPAELRST